MAELVTLVYTFGTQSEIDIGSIIGESEKESSSAI